MNKIPTRNLPESLIRWFIPSDNVRNHLGLTVVMQGPVSLPCGADPLVRKRPPGRPMSRPFLRRGGRFDWRCACTAQLLISLMVQFSRPPTFSPAPKSTDERRRNQERRREPRVRTEAIPAYLTDLYRQRVPVVVLDVSRSGVGLKVDERFAVDLPVLLECQGLLIVGDIRHCVPAETGGYVLGMKIHRIEEAAPAGAHNEHRSFHFPSPRTGSHGSRKTPRAAKLGGVT
jgi:hypothetical protein